MGASWAGSNGYEGMNLQNLPNSTSSGAISSSSVGSASSMERLKILINSSTPIIVMETVEEVRALMLVRAACSDLSLPIFEWTIADGLVRSGGDGAGATRTLSAVSHEGLAPKTAMYNTPAPVQRV